MKTPGIILLLALAFAPVKGDAQSVLWLDLSGDWRISADESPEYARPDFDDSAWATVHLPRGKPRPESGFRPVRWMRRSVELPREAGRGIAEAARAWGQNDDITVVTVRRRE